MSIVESVIRMQFYDLKKSIKMKEVENYYQELEAFQRQVKEERAVDFQKFSQFQKMVASGEEYVQSFESSCEVEVLRDRQKEYRAFTDPIFKKSFFVNRARTWPLGYPGDHEMLEKIYNGIPISEEGIGLYIDTYFLCKTLAKGVRERKRVLSQLVQSEIENRPINTRIMNIGCGSSREIFDIGSSINQYQPKFTFLDFDEKATIYSKQLLENTSIDTSDFVFKKFNALKLSNAEYTQKIFGNQDIIYSAGLFDYLKTDVLSKIIASLYANLNNDGIVIAPFKDVENYNTFDYHWNCDWTYFYQRSIEEVKNILTDAIPSSASLEIKGTGVPAINFFIIRK